jgi:uncharacterized protein
MSEETVPVPELSEAPAPAQGWPRRVWGPWWTTGLLFLILGAMFLVQSVIGLFWIFAVSFHQPRGNALGNLEALQYDGDLLAMATVIGAVAALALVGFLVWLRRGATLREYLALKPVRWKTALLWIGGTLAFLASYDLISRALDRPFTPEFMIQVYTSATLLPLLWIAVVLAAPLWEETVFRGFAFPGLRNSRFGLIAAILVPNLLWASLHLLQYDAFDMAYVFLLGVLCGFARERTGSVMMPVSLHVLTNGLAMIQVAMR